jgi:transglutaminase-like putative cysteine protease/predicted glutamine amidotransferase
MPNLLAMSFEGELAPSFDLRCLQPGRKLPDGWGIGYYPGGEPSASVLKEPAPPQGSIRGELIKAWEHLASSLFVLHVRTATWGSPSDANTQPFLRSYGGRDWLIAHAGSLLDRLAPLEGNPFEPVGSTDTEQVFCELLGRMARAGWKSLGEADLGVVQGWLEAIDTHGTLSIVLTDGHDLLVYADAAGDVPVYVWQPRPPYEELAFGDDDLEVDLAKRGLKARKGIVVATRPLEAFTTREPVEPDDAGEDGSRRDGDGDADADADADASQKERTALEWKRLEPGHLLIARQGAVRAEVGPKRRTLPPTVPVVLPPPSLAFPPRAATREYEIVHRTVYLYKKPVERSTHTLRLAPVIDRLQHVHEHSLSVSVDGKSRDFEDVFGNRTRRLLIETPYTELAIESRSRVEVLDVEPIESRTLRTRATIPLLWMPWQRQTLQPFLLPTELPETQLDELVEYAMSFVERNDYDLLDTLSDINQSIFREYAYRQGATSLATTAFDVYVHRRGVCQDFTNLFICLARLLGVPARYTCGYIYTGPKNPNQLQSEASHAWVQVYLPEVGWRGFDPTNGIVTQTDHVRVAVGRNYVDATPTSGTLYLGGGGETLRVDVRMERI